MSEKVQELSMNITKDVDGGLNFCQSILLKEHFMRFHAEQADIGFRDCSLLGNTNFLKGFTSTVWDACDIQIS